MSPVMVLKDGTIALERYLFGNTPWAKANMSLIIWLMIIVPGLLAVGEARSAVALPGGSAPRLVVARNAAGESKARLCTTRWALAACSSSSRSGTRRRS